MAFVKQFFFLGEFAPSINTTWVSMIPKVNNPSKILEYRPISVVGCLYKIKYKVLANRLKPIIGDVSSENQTWFIKNKLIFDGILTPNESAMWLKSKKKKGAILKEDFKKAYAFIRWNFLEHMLS